MVARLDAPPGPRAGALTPPRARPTVDASPLTSDHFTELSAARVRARKVRRAAAVARTSGWLTAAFGVLSILGGLSDGAALALGVGLVTVAWNEFGGSALLRRFDERGPARLAWGQLALALMLVGYAGWRIAETLGPAPAAASSDPQVQAMLAEMNVDGLIRSIAVAVYAGVGLVGVVAPALTALYYRTRARHLRAFLAGTPAWIVRAMSD